MSRPSALNRFTHVLLVLTSLAPMALIHGVSKALVDPGSCAAFVGLAVGLGVLCHVVLRWAAAHGEDEQVVIEKSKSADREAAGFFVAYALPLVAATDRPQNVLALCAFVVVLLVVLLRLDVVHVNPLLTVWRYHFFEVSPKSGETAVLLTMRHGAPGRIHVVKLSPSIWLEIDPWPNTK